MKYVYIYDIATGRIMGKTSSTANYKKLQDSLIVVTDVIFSDQDIKPQFIFNFQVNLETKQIERKPIS